MDSKLSLKIDLLYRAISQNPSDYFLVKKKIGNLEQIWFIGDNGNSKTKCSIKFSDRFIESNFDGSVFIEPINSQLLNKLKEINELVPEFQIDFMD